MKIPGIAYISSTPDAAEAETALCEGGWIATTVLGAYSVGVSFTRRVGGTSGALRIDRRIGPGDDMGFAWTMALLEGANGREVANGRVSTLLAAIRASEGAWTSYARRTVQ